MPPTLTFTGRTDVGRVRTRNEDTFRTDEDGRIAVVADGMGGHPGGDVASRVAADAALAFLRGEEDNLDDAAGETMARCVRLAHEAVRTEGRRQPELQGMGTTLTILRLHPASRGWAVGHVGDSRAYLLRDRSLERITRDDTWVQHEVEAGRLSSEAVRSHPASHVLSQCVGLDAPPQPRLYSGRIRPRDRFLLCSDGLTGMLTDEEIRTVLLSHESPDAVADALVRGALDEGGVDNVTVVVVHVAADRDVS